MTFLQNVTPKKRAPAAAHSFAARSDRHTRPIAQSPHPSPRLLVKHRTGWHTSCHRHAIHLTASEEKAHNHSSPTASPCSGNQSPLKTRSRSREAYEYHTNTAHELARMRRAAIRELHETGLTYPEMAPLLGISEQAVAQLCQKAGKRPAPRWWERVPEDVANEVKLGPGGVPLDQLVPSDAVLGAVVKAMGTASKRNSKRAFTTAELESAAQKALKRAVPRSAIRLALQRGMKQGQTVRVRWGQYGPKPKRRPAAASSRSR